ncbi:MAG: hypothetical protein KIS66_05525 [Fimbriimonadaceae bacterium]|nr:hypothetical protein [Fimbriimonadaceae bacterium]
MLSFVPALVLGAASAREVVVVPAWKWFRESPDDPSVRRRQWDDLHALSVLQGLVNRREPRLYVLLVGDQGSVDRYWWRRMAEPGGWMAGAKVVELETLDAVLARFRSSVRGTVIWDERVPATSALASTLAGMRDAVPVRFDDRPDSLYRRWVTDSGGPRLKVIERLLGADGKPRFTGTGTIPGTNRPSTGSAKCDAYLWAADRFIKTGRCDPRRMGYYPDAFWIGRGTLPVDRTLLSNHDYFVAKRGFFFDLGSWDDEAPDDDPDQKPGEDARTLRAILAAAYARAKGAMIHVGGFTPWDLKYTDFTGRKHGGVPTEWRYAEILSCFNAYMDADAPGLGPMANASFFMHFPLKARYPQPKLADDAELLRQGLVEPSGRPVAKPFVAFYVGDYDSAAWLYRMMPETWDDPLRGTVPLGWAFNPNLADRFPVGMDYARRTATPNDAFITGDSGAGYLNPGNLVPPRQWSGLPSGLDAWVAHCRPHYRRWDLAVTGFVIDGYAPPMPEDVLRAYAKLSPGGVVAQKVPESSLVDGVPFLRMGADLNGGDLDASTRTILGDAATPGFRLYRTILWTVKQHREAMARVKAANPNVAFVTPPVLLELLRRERAPQR